MTGAKALVLRLNEMSDTIIHILLHLSHLAVVGHAQSHIYTHMRHMTHTHTHTRLG